MIEISPSIIAADYARLADALRQIEQGGAQLVHVDVMDGHFVPNLTIGAPVAKSLGKATKLPLDCHLMIEHPERWIESYIDAGAARISIHLEACTHLDRAVAAIRSGGAQPGVAINPATPIEALSEILPQLGHVLLMSVNPGFAGQSFIASSIDKTRRLAAEIERRELGVTIQVDGGVDASNIGALVAAGARSFVAGSAVFAAEDPVAAIRALKAAGESAL